MRLKQFIIQEGRSKHITENEAYDILEKYCKTSLKKYFKGIGLYRGVRSMDSNYNTIDPKKFDRISKNNKNYYTLINDNSPCWKGYPKRSQSIIFINGVAEASMYGNVYIVFPYDNADIAIGSAFDYWSMFKETIGIGLEYFVGYIERLFEQVDIKLTDKSYNSIKKSFKEFDDKLKTHTGLKIYFKQYTFMKGYDGNLMEHLQNLMCPDKNGIKLVKIDNIKKMNTHHEMWTDNKCVTINYNMADKLESHFK